MRTPREILLEHHQGANVLLDDIRRAVVAELPRRSAREPRVPFALKLWRELIWPCRRTWATLAAVWLVLAVFSLAHPRQNRVALATASPPRAEWQVALKEQRRVLDEILGPGWSPPSAAAPRRPGPQPRSERRSVMMV